MNVQSCNGASRRYLWPGFKVLITHTRTHQQWHDTLANGPHLQLFALSRGHVTSIYNIYVYLWGNGFDVCFPPKKAPIANDGFAEQSHCSLNNRLAEKVKSRLRVLWGMTFFNNRHDLYDLLGSVMVVGQWPQWCCRWIYGFLFHLYLIRCPDTLQLDFFIKKTRTFNQKETRWRCYAASLTVLISRNPSGLQMGPVRFIKELRTMLQMCTLFGNHSSCSGGGQR